MRARGAQALTVLVLSVLAVAGAVGAPWYILAAERSALLADIATAPADQRVVTASRVLRLSDTDPAAGLGAFRATVERSLSIPGVRPVLGLSGLADAVGPDGGGVRGPGDLPGGRVRPPDPGRPLPDRQGRGAAEPVYRGADGSRDRCPDPGTATRARPGHADGYRWSGCTYRRTGTSRTGPALRRPASTARRTGSPIRCSPCSTRSWRSPRWSSRR